MRCLEPHQVISAGLVEGQLEVVRRYPSNSMFACDPPRKAPDTIEKDVYGIVDGKIQLIEIISGQHVPAHSVAEQFTF